MIRPFQPGDTFLLQRLQRQAPKLNVAQALLQPRSPVWAALTAGNPLHQAKVATYVLHQNGHGLARSGFVQAQRRPGRSDVDILMLAPALDTRTGHPAIWEKLLAHCIVEGTQESTARIYADVPDQPLLVNTFAHVGFGVYARQSIWRLAPNEVANYATQHASIPALHAAAAQRATGAPTTHVRMAQRSDEWELQRLYARVTPRAVQRAEGVLVDAGSRPPILDWWLGGDVQTFVSGDGAGAAEALNGCLRVVSTRTGVWMQLWADAHRTDADAAKALLGNALRFVQNQRRRRPIYIPVRDYQGGLGPLLSDFGFAPFADHAKMVKHLLQRVVETENVRQLVVEPASEIVVTAGGYSPPPIRTDSVRGMGGPLLRHRTGSAHTHTAATSSTALRAQGQDVEQDEAAYRR